MTIRARELATRPEAHNQVVHPAKAAAIADASHEVTVTVTDPSLSMTVVVPQETAPVIAGNKLDPLTITTRKRGGDGEMGQERTGYVDLLTQNVGNTILLNMRFGEGAERLVAVLTRDGPGSDFKLHVSDRLPEADKFPAFLTKLGGKFGYVQITNVMTRPASEEGYSHTRVSWKYTAFYERTSGAPINRLKQDETAPEIISFVAEGQGDNATEDVTFTLGGIADRPILVLASSPGGDRPASADEFPLILPEEGSVRRWAWWNREDIIEYSRAAPMDRTATVDVDEGVVWRFVPIDVDGDYFKPAHGTAAPRGYGDIAAFINSYIRFKGDGGESWKPDHPYLEIVQARDSTDAPLFMAMPGSRDQVPVLELRLKEGATAPSSFNVTVMLLGTGQDMGANRVSVLLQITLADSNDTPPVFDHEAPDPVREDVALGINATTRGDGKVVYDAAATPDVACDSVIYSLNQNAGDDAGMFDIDDGSGEVWFTVAPNYETSETYSFTVIARVGDRDAEQTVTISVTNVNDTALTWAALGNVSVVEGVRDTGLVVTTAEKTDRAGRDVTYEIVDAEMRDIFEISSDGRLIFCGETDHDDGRPNSYAVKIRATSAPVRQGGITQTAEQTVTVTVTDVVDELLPLVRDDELATGDGLTAISDGAARLRKGTDAGKILCKVAVPTPDVDGNYVYVYLSGDDAGLFTIDGDGNLRLRAKADHEAKSSYDVTIHAREVTDEPTGHNLTEHPAKSGMVNDAEHKVTINVANINDQPTIIHGGDTRRPLVAENTINAVYEPQLSKDRAVTRTEWTLSGDDAHLFTVDELTGAVRFKVPPDYEDPQDKDGDNRYDVTLAVTTFDAGGREQSATQDIEINVFDVSIVIDGSPLHRLTISENHAEVITDMRFTIDEDDFDRVEVTTDGSHKNLFKVENHLAPNSHHLGYFSLKFKRPPNFETQHLDFGEEDAAGALYSVDVVITAFWADGTRKFARKSILISLQDDPEAPKISLERNSGFYILSTERRELRDTGYRIDASDEDGDPFTLSLNGNTHLRLNNGNQIWIKKKKIFDSDVSDSIAVQVKARETGPDGKTTILPFTIPIKRRLDDVDDMFRIVGDAVVPMDENLPVKTAAYTPSIAWGDGYESSMAVIWSLGGTHSDLLRIDAATGVVRFITSPDYESDLKVYSFTIMAEGVGGQLVNRKAVTINIQDVDDNAPSEMLIIDVHDDNEFTPAELERSENRKLAKIRFKDVDSQDGNDVETDRASRERFEIRPATHADDTIKEGAYRLWLKDGVALDEGSYTITITPVINGARVEDMQKTFTFTVVTKSEQAEAQPVGQKGNTLSHDPPSSNHPNGQPSGNQSTEVVEYPIIEPEHQNMVPQMLEIA